MSRTVVAGLDGSAESQAAAEWAAREAELRGRELRLLHVKEKWGPTYGYVPLVEAAASAEYEAGRIPRDARERLAARHPGLAITTGLEDGKPVEVLAEAADGAEVLVLGSRGLSAVTGFFVGSVSQSVIARAERPVVLVRVGQDESPYRQAPDGSGPLEGDYRPVLLGLDLSRPCEELIAYAFDAAAARGATLRVVHGWSLPPVYGYPAMVPAPTPQGELEASVAKALRDTLRPWRAKFPGVEVEEECVVGRAADHLAQASADACLTVVGRRIRRAAAGVHVGPVTHAVLHHSVAPVAVVPHP